MCSCCIYSKMCCHIENKNSLSRITHTWIGSDQKLDINQAVFHLPSHAGGSYVLTIKMSMNIPFI